MAEKLRFDGEVVVAVGVFPAPATSRTTESSPELRDCLVIFIEDREMASPGVVLAKIYWFNEFSSVPLGRAKLLLRGTASAKFESASVLPFREFQQRFDLAVLFVGNRRSYRQLIDLAHRERARALLIRASEIGALHAFQPAARALRLARSDPAFNELFSSDEEHFAFLAMRRLFEEDRMRFPPDIARIDAKVEIATDTLLPVRLEFRDALRAVQPLTVIIGANGAGKTRFLLGLARAAMGRGAGRATAVLRDETEESLRGFSPVSFTYEPQLWTGARRSGAKVVPLGVARSTWRSLTRRIQELALAENSDFSIPAFARVMSEVVHVDDMRLPTGWRTNLDAGETEPSIRLTDLVQRGSNELIAAINPAREVFFQSENNGRYNLSSGQRSILLFTANLYEDAGSGALVLLDEPENHLHPKYVSIMMQTLRRTLLATESRAVVVTHSPYVVREVDTSAVLVMGKDSDGETALFRTTLQTLGADVSAISDYVFGDLDVKKAYEQRIDELVREADGDVDRVIEEFVNGVGVDAEIYLRVRAQKARRVVQ